MVQTFTIQARATEKIIAFAQRYEVNADSLYHAVDLNPTLLPDPDNRIPFSQLVDLYEKAAEFTKDANFGLHLGETVNPKAFDLVGYIALNSPTLGEALARLTRYHSIWTDGAAFSSDFAQYCLAGLQVHRPPLRITGITVNDTAATSSAETLLQKIDSGGG
jgi:hypothetical protein